MASTPTFFFGILMSIVATEIAVNGDNVVPLGATQCPKGFILLADDNGGQSCQCGAYPGIDCLTWNGNVTSCWMRDFYCGSIPEDLLPENTSVYNSFGTGAILPLNAIAKYSETELEKRSGIFLTNCSDNLTISLFDGVTCTDCSQPNPVPAIILLVLVESLPIYILFSLIVLFNVNLASGVGHSFLFFYQTVPLVMMPFAEDQPQQVYTIKTFGILLDFFSLNNPILRLVDVRHFPCLSKEQTLFMIYLLRYLRILYTVVFIVVIILLVKCHCCPAGRCGMMWVRIRRQLRNFREKFTCKGTILVGIGSIIMILYGGIFDISFNILSQSSLYYFQSCPNQSTVRLDQVKTIPLPMLDGSTTYLSESHKPYAVVSICILMLSGFIPVLMLYKPAIPMIFTKFTGKSLPSMNLNRLEPFFDVFQGVYKPHFRFFSGLYILYRAILWAIFALAPNLVLIELFLILTLVLILSVHCLIQPFQKQLQNYVETLFLLNITIIAGLMQAKLIIQLLPDIFSDDNIICLLHAATLALMYTPIAILMVFAIYKAIKSILLRRRSTYVNLEDTTEIKQPVGSSLQEENQSIW